MHKCYAQIAEMLCSNCRNVTLKIWKHCAQIVALLGIPGFYNAIRSIANHCSLSLLQVTLM